MYSESNAQPVTDQHDSASVAELAPGPSLQDRPPHGLISLWDMFRIQLEHYITLGKNLATLRHFLENPNAGHLSVTRDGATRVLDVPSAIVAAMGQLRDACSAIDLPVSRDTIDEVMLGGFRSSDQIETLLDLVQSEMKTRLFLHVPASRAKYWETDEHLSERARVAFPVAAIEIRAAGTAYACGLWSASIFHAMRAAEGALIALSDELGIERSGAEQWGNVIERIEAKLKDIAKLPKSHEVKQRNLQPLSELVIDLRLFKDAWRNQIAHNIASYHDGHARTVFDAVCRVLDAVAARRGTWV